MNISFSIHTLTISINSSFVYTFPVGLEGLVRISIFDFSVIAASNSSLVSLNPFSLFVSMNFGTAPVSLTISG